MSLDLLLKRSFAVAPVLVEFALDNCPEFAVNRIVVPVEFLAHFVFDDVRQADHMACEVVNGTNAAGFFD